ncbi:MAG: M23 family metallopeptidase [Novosphingobium sp.]
MPALLIPVEGVRARQLTDTFTQARAGGARRHDAIDIPAPVGTPVRAAAPGFIEKLFQSRDGGNTVYLRSPDRRVIYYYAHLDRYAAGLAERQSVSAGQVIGTVGFSGNASPAAPHLHFAITVTMPQARWWDRGQTINPYPLLTRR